VRGRWRRRCGKDYVPNAFDISEHFIVPESQYAIAMTREPSIADGVAWIGLVLPAVHFDETLFAADEVNDVGADWFLSHELETAESSRA
jgi:hypothetical protein